MKILFIIYDDEAYIHYFPLNIAYLIPALKQRGYDQITIYNQDVYHYQEEHLVDYLKSNHFDVVGIGIVAGYYPYQKLLKISKAINSLPNRPFYIIGGHGPSPEPEYFLRKTQADAVAIGEAELSLPNLLDALSTKRNLSEVRGIAYRDGEKVIVNEREELINDIDSLPMPAWEYFPMDYYTLRREVGVKRTERTFQVLTGRGCPFECNFCYRMESGFRPRSSEAIIEEMQKLKRDYGVTYFLFADDLLMSSKRRTIEFCEKMIRANLNTSFICNGRLNYAHPEILTVMKRAGCRFINYGIESLDERALRVMKKNLTVEQITKGVENTIAADIDPGLNIIFGNIGETAESLKKGVEFILKYNTYAQTRTIRPVTPYPGSPLYYYAIEKGLLKDVADFYEHKHINSEFLSVNFTDLSDDDFHRLLCEANKTLLKDYYKHQLEEALDVTEKLYGNKNKNFRGYRQT
ncbi:B12-binding domain-containing radical SAM protein [Chloroflexota bacterium]